MSVTVRIPTNLRPYTGGIKEVSVSPGTVREIITAVASNYEGVGKYMIGPEGQLTPHSNVFIDDEDVRFLQGLDTPVPAGATVSIMNAVAGG